MKSRFKTGKVISLFDYIRHRDPDKNVYVRGRLTSRRSDTLVPEYHQIMDMITFIDQMVRTATECRADKLYFEYRGETGDCRIFKEYYAIN